MYLLIDIGATNTRVGISENLSKLGKYNILPSSSDYNLELHNIKKSAQLLSKGKKFKAVAVGLAGSMDDKKTVLRISGLRDYAYKPVKKDFESAFKTKVLLENDAALAGLGEAVFGAGKEFKSLAYLTFSTGVGGVKIDDKRISSNIFGFEPKHLIIASNKGLLKWGETVEGRSLQKKYKKLPEQITDKKTWQDIEAWMCIGIHNAAVMWSPEAIIIGGAIAHNSNISIQRIRDFVKETLNYVPKQPEIIKSKLGQLNGLYGALALLKK